MTMRRAGRPRPGRSPAALSWRKFSGVMRCRSRCYWRRSRLSCQKHQTVAATIAFCFTLDHWLKRMLVPDWDKRIRRKQNGCSRFHGLLSVMPALWPRPDVAAVGPRIFGGLGFRSLTDVGGMLALIVFQSITMIVLQQQSSAALFYSCRTRCRPGLEMSAMPCALRRLRGTINAVALTLSAISIGGMVLGPRHDSGLEHREACGRGRGRSLQVEPWSCSSTCSRFMLSLTA